MTSYSATVVFRRSIWFGQFAGCPATLRGCSIKFMVNSRMFFIVAARARAFPVPRPVCHGPVLLGKTMGELLFWAI